MGHTRRKIRISILNWNAIDKTLACIESLEQALVGIPFDIRLRIIDNGSAPTESEALRHRLGDTKLIHFRQNQGFAAGHNVVIQEAIHSGDDYIWVLNNDTQVSTGVLEALVNMLEEDATCGAVSPVLLEPADAQGRHAIDFLGSYHDLATLRSVRLEDAKSALDAERERPFDMWVAGTAVLYRVAALRQVGMFDHNYFAYFEDNDLGMRLAAAGWTSRVAFEAKLIHHAHDDMLRDRQPYYFYLMTRNAFLFWLKYCPEDERGRRRRRLLARSLWTARNLHDGGYLDKRNACLRGAIDGWNGISGPVRIDETPPRWLIALSAKFPHKVYCFMDSAGV